MLIKVLFAVVILLAVFLGFISTREGKFRYERSGVINAPPAKIFPYLSDFKKGGEWSPFEKADPNMKKTFKGPGGQVGSVMEFDGNRDAGAGSLEILKLVPDQEVQIRLIMTKPLKADNIVTYRLTPGESGTLFSWSMEGDGGFLGKLVNFFIDCEKMVADQFTAGIQNLKTLVEGQK